MRIARAIGEMLGGLALTLSGFTGEILGTGLSSTGIGAAIGVPAMVVSAGLVAAGAASMEFGVQDFRNAWMSKASGGGGGGTAATPRNGHLAGGEHPKTNIPFDKDGYPDFKAAGLVKAEVKITFSGSRPIDDRLANKAAGLSRTPDDYVWHHHQDGTTMQLVPRGAHGGTGHTGGFSLWRNK